MLSACTLDFGDDCSSVSSIPVLWLQLLLSNVQLLFFTTAQSWLLTNISGYFLLLHKKVPNLSKTYDFRMMVVVISLFAALIAVQQWAITIFHHCSFLAINPHQWIISSSPKKCFKCPMTKLVMCHKVLLKMLLSRHL